jgi:hypothetical protein
VKSGDNTFISFPFRSFFLFYILYPLSCLHCCSTDKSMYGMPLLHFHIASFPYCFISILLHFHDPVSRCAARYKCHKFSTLSPATVWNMVSSYLVSFMSAFSSRTVPFLRRSSQSRKYPVHSYPASHLSPCEGFQCDVAKSARKRT